MLRLIEIGPVILVKKNVLKFTMSLYSRGIIFPW